MGIKTRTSTNVKFSLQDTYNSKTIAIIMMYIHHLFNVNSLKGVTVSYTLLTESQMLDLAQLCKVCVAIFVFLSAYGITVSFLEKDKKDERCLKQLYLDNGCRYIKLWFGFIVIYVLAQIFSFLGRNGGEVYGKGVNGGVHCYRYSWVGRSISCTYI